MSGDNLSFFSEFGPNRVWRTYSGGKVLDSIQKKENPADSNFPEDWIGSVTPAKNIGREDETEEGLSRIDLDGQQVLFKDLLEKYHSRVLGESHYYKYGATMQFLLKFLDSRIRLHVQAHPTIPFAQKHLGSNAGKTEGYYILSTRSEVKDPCIYLGFKNSPEREQLRSWIEGQNIDKVLDTMHRISVKQGDSFIVPGGMPHAIGEGVFMVEIMEPTDFAVRLEFERGGYVLPEAARFMDRGIDFALDMIEFNGMSLEQLKEKYFVKPVRLDSHDCLKESFIDKRFTECFRVEKITADNPCLISVDSAFILIVLAGAGTMRADGSELQIRRWQRVFVPFSAGELELNPCERTELLCVFPPF